MAHYEVIFSPTSFSPKLSKVKKNLNRVWIWSPVFPVLLWTACNAGPVYSSLSDGFTPSDCMSLV
jgi:hypothetical protein